MTGTPADVAGMIGAMRTAMKSAGNYGNNILQVEILCWIAAGIDNLPDLVRLCDSPKKTVISTIHLLEGRGKLRDGRVRHSPFRLVQRRKHPHLPRTHQLLLTADGHQLITKTFGVQTK